MSEEEVLDEEVEDSEECSRNKEADNLKTNKAWGLKRDCTFVSTCAQLGKKFLYYSERNFQTPRKYKTSRKIQESRRIYNKVQEIQKSKEYKHCSSRSGG